MKTTTCLIALFTCAQNLLAVPTVFFGEDLRGQPIDNSQAARASFVSQFRDISVQDLEAIPTGPMLDTLLPFRDNAARVTPAMPVFGVGVISSTRIDAPSGEMAIAAGVGFTMDFQNPVQGFGFYGVDFGDRRGAVSLDYETVSGTIGNIAIPHLVGDSSYPNPEDLNESVIFFGLDFGTDWLTHLSFRNTAFEEDGYLVDDITLSARDVPETMPLGASAVVLGLVCLWQRRKI